MGYNNKCMRVNTKCNVCGDDFDYNPLKRCGRYCSKECRNSGSSGNNSSIEEVCSICGKSFEYSVMENGVICSSECADKLASKIPCAETEDCKSCGTRFVYNASRRDRKYCSSECLYSNTNSERRSTKYQSYKNDFEKCEVCENNTELEVHHVIPVRLDKERTDEEENLIALCDRCHFSVDEHRRGIDVGEREKQWRLGLFKDETRHQRARLMNDTTELEIIKHLFYEK